MDDQGREITLAIETSNPSASRDDAAGEVAIGAAGRADERIDSRQLLRIEALTPRSPHDDALLPAIDRALRASEVDAEEIDVLAVSAGPGGFTGLRIAVTTAKVICEVSGARLVLVPSWESPARRAIACGVATGRFAVALASKREAAWIVCCDPPQPGEGPAAPPVWRPEPRGAVMTMEELAAAHQAAPLRALIADRHLPGAMRSWVETAGVDLVEPEFRAEAVWDAAMQRAPADLIDAAPLYPREPEAVRRWRSRPG